MFVVYDSLANEYVTSLINSRDTTIDDWFCDSPLFAQWFPTREEASEFITDLMATKFEGWFPNEICLIVKEI